MRGRRAKLWLWHCLFLGGEREREAHGSERERSRALCTSHLGDEKNETAAEKGKKGKATEWCSFQNKFPRVERGAEKEREREHCRFSKIMKDHNWYIS